MNKKEKEKLEQLEKENEEFQKANKMLNDYIISIQSDYVSKDKIKAKINQIDEEYSKTLEKELSLEFHNINAQRHEAMKIVLEELLGE